MAKIKITQPTEDQETGERYKVGKILDLGGVRNKRAVETNQAVWYNEAEKKETANIPKQKVSKAGSKTIEIKDKDGK